MRTMLELTRCMDTYTAANEHAEWLMSHLIGTTVTREYQMLNRLKQLAADHDWHIKVVDLETDEVTIFEP